MLIVAERINASRKAIRAALERLDTAAIVNEVRIQAQAGAHYIDLNGGTFPGRETELLCWLVDTAQAETDLPLCIDSPDPDALAAALPRVRGERPMINSINLEPERFARVLPLAREHNAKLIALAQGEGVPAASAAEKVDLASLLVERLLAAGMVLDDIYVDPLVFPVGTDSASGLATVSAMREIMARFPGVHTICGLTNVSHGLPARKLVNRTFLAGAIANGMDAAIIDPTDTQLMATLYAAEAVFGRDEYCVNFIEAFQAGKLV
ncbi:MAG: methyltetrahydrofolate cobalamin methyltransferase [Betaproteobacteria bacterium]|nr:MAG: methyltetrahydrofolate cobalamin methyltransferase [Betaproteobacteria bacterium]